MIISYPGEYLEGEVSDNLVSALDLLPTISSAARCQTPGYVDGIDLNPLLKGEDKELQHDALFWDTRQETAARTGKYKMRTGIDDANARYEMVELELGEFLYDLEQDIGERINLKDSLPQTYKELQREFKNWRNKINK
jgi:arylsulfatase A-like enzyme